VGPTVTPTSGRTEPPPSSGSSRAAPRLGPHAKAAFLGLFKPRRHLLLAPFRETLAAELQLRHRRTLARPSLLSISAVTASPPTRRPPGELQGGEEDAHVACSRPRARRCPDALTGVGAAAAVRPAVLCVVAVS
jgi:hypothetical protein